MSRLIGILAAFIAVAIIWALVGGASDRIRNHGSPEIVQDGEIQSDGFLPWESAPGLRQGGAGY